MKVDLTQVTKFMTRTSKYVGIKIWQHSPTILAVLGTSGIIGAGVMACKATLKLEETVSEKNEDIQTVKTSLENAKKIVETDGENADHAQEYIDKFYKKELAAAYLNMGAAIGKLYGPAVLVCAASVGCIFGSKKIMDNRYSACLAACTTTERLFADYRKRVTEDLGKEADQKYRFGMETKEIEIPELDKKGNEKKDKNGKTKTKKQRITTIPSNLATSDYARVFDEVSSREWDRNVDMNVVGLLQKQRYANDLLQSRGWLFLNEVYLMLGFPVTDYGQDVGWIFEKDNPIGDNVVDFGLYKAYRPDSTETRLMAMCPQNNAILLDFNVDGYIKDRLFEAQNLFD
jgi:hypothetical protein